MKKTILITSEYGFCHNWSLVIYNKKYVKQFFLGQDVKFCSRVLGMSTSDVVASIGTNQIAEGTVGNTKLANFIYKELGLNVKKVNELESWDLCSQ
jgi:hypothetical protein